MTYFMAICYLHFLSENRASAGRSLELALEQYMELVDWTGRQIRGDKRGAIPADLAPILQRLRINRSLWVDTLNTFDDWAHRVIGNATDMARKAHELGRNYLHGISTCREVFDED